MKNTNHCPKCDSTRIIKFEGSQFKQHTIAATSKWGLNVAIIDRYFCVNCGYTEEYAQLSPKFKKWANEELDKQGRGGNYDGFV
jgi:predicted nucleic-acid-binding Zn-ribbon protein